MELKLSPPEKKKKTKIKYYVRYVDSLQVGVRGGGGKNNKYLNAKKQKCSSCDDRNSRKKRLRVRDNQPFLLKCDMRPFFIGQETSIVARLEHNPQTDKT